MALRWFRPSVRLVLLGVVALGLALLGSSSFDRPIPSYQVGEFTDRAIRAPFEFTITDDDATRRQRLEAAQRTPAVVDVNPAVPAALEATMARVFAPLATAVTGVPPAPDPAPASASARTKRAADEKLRAHQRALDEAISSAVPGIEATVGSPAPQELRALLGREGAVADLRAGLAAIIKAAYARPVVIDLAAVWSSVSEGETRPDTYAIVLVTGTAERRAQQPGALTDLGEARAEVLGAQPSNAILARPVEAWLRQAVAGALRPNASVNLGRTRERRAAAAAAVIPVSLSFRRNQLIIGEGQPVTRQTVLVLDHLRAQRSAQYAWRRLVVRTGLLFAALTLAFVMFEGRRPRFIDSDPMFAYGLTSLTVAAAGFLAWDSMMESVLARIPGMAALSVMIAFPSAAPAMYSRLVAPQTTVARLLVAQALVFGLMWQGDARLAFFVLASGWVGSHLVAQCTRRHCVLRAGLVTGLVSAPIAAFLNALDSSWQGPVTANAVAGLLSGVFSSLVVLALGPVYEFAFGHVTRIRLVELVNYQHPLLRKLTEVTPGTFQHSVGVGVLGDAAARATGGDGLLVRVGALYHDVGKTKRPEMFVENQQGWNPHDQLPPLESARNIIEHVTEGVRLVREYKLGERIVDFVREHHGTSKVHYFLAKAMETGNPVDPEEFTYPGPAPRSLETLILMLADQVEATARSMPGADAAALAAMVDRTLDRARTEGQLDECPATFRDLAAIRDALVRTLGGMAHRRITYPGQPATTGAPEVPESAAVAGSMRS